MLMSEFAEVKWNSANKKKYVDLGYEFTKMGDTFKVNVNHLTKGSHSLVKVKCDYCGKEYEREYKKYLYCHNKSDNHEDCCEKCIGSKSTKTYKMKHGESYLSNPENQQKLKQSIIDKYGVDNGITLCEKCHNEFHNHYGRGNNTKSQYIEFDKTFRKS